MPDTHNFSAIPTLTEILAKPMSEISGGTDVQSVRDYLGAALPETIQGYIARLESDAALPNRPVHSMELKALLLFINNINFEVIPHLDNNPVDFKDYKTFTTLFSTLENIGLRLGDDVIRKQALALKNMTECSLEVFTPDITVSTADLKHERLESPFRKDTLEDRLFAFSMTTIPNYQGEQPCNILYELHQNMPYNLGYASYCLEALENGKDITANDEDGEAHDPQKIKLLKASITNISQSLTGLLKGDSLTGEEKLAINQLPAVLKDYEGIMRQILSSSAIIPLSIDMETVERQCNFILNAYNEAKNPQLNPHEKRSSNTIGSASSFEGGRC